MLTSCRARHLGETNAASANVTKNDERERLPKGPGDVSPGLGSGGIKCVGVGTLMTGSSGGGMGRGVLATDSLTSCVAGAGFGDGS